MSNAGTQQPGGDRTPSDEAIEADPQPQSTPHSTPQSTATVPEEDDPEIEETEEQPS